MAIGKNIINKINAQIDEILAGTGNLETKLMQVCETLANNLAHYQWVGFYLVDEKEKNCLVLGPFSGAPTEHARIPFGKGVCGQTAELKKTMVVQDVSREPNYLSCSINVKSEIVVPVVKDDTVKGVLDIDSHQLAPFNQEDVDTLESICNKLAPLF